MVLITDATVNAVPTMTSSPAVPGSLHVGFPAAIQSALEASDAAVAIPHNMPTLTAAIVNLRIVVNRLSR